MAPIAAPTTAAWQGVAFLAVIFLISSIARLMLGPLLPAIEADLKISHTQAGGVITLISAGYFIMQFAAGWLASRIQHRHIIAGSALLMGLAMTGLAGSQSLLWVNLSCFTAGLSFGLYLPSAIATITTLTPEAQFGKAIGLHEAAPNLAFMIAPLIAELMVGLGSWRSAPLVLALCSGALGVFYTRWGQGGHFKGKPFDFKMAAALSSQPALWLGGLMFFLGVCTTAGCFSMLPLYLVIDHQIDNRTVNLLLSLSRLACLATAFLAGVLCDRLGPFKALATFVGLTGSFTLLLGLTEGMVLWVFIFLQAAFTVCIFPPAYAYLANGFDPRVRNLAVSLASAMGLLAGNGLVPPLIGYLGERGHFGMGFAVVGAFLLAMLPVLFIIERRR